MVPEVVLKVLKIIYLSIRPWLFEQAAKTETPIDNWMLEVFDMLLGVEKPAQP